MKIALSVEQQVKQVWCDLLKLEDIDPGQEFFQLGGDSLMMIDMIVRLNNELGLEIDPSILFSHPSLSAFSAQIANMKKKSGETGTI